MTPVHGLPATYVNHRCRCDHCKRAWADAVAARKARRYAKRIRNLDGRLIAPGLPEESHGRQATYVNHGCRCNACTDAHATANRARRARAKETAA